MSSELFKEAVEAAASEIVEFTEELHPARSPIWQEIEVLLNRHFDTLRQQLAEAVEEMAALRRRLAMVSGMANEAVEEATASKLKLIEARCERDEAKKRQTELELDLDQAINECDHRCHERDAALSREKRWRELAGQAGYYLKARDPSDRNWVKKWIANYDDLAAGGQDHLPDATKMVDAKEVERG